MIIQVRTYTSFLPATAWNEMRKLHAMDLMIIRAWQHAFIFPREGESGGSHRVYYFACHHYPHS